ncbi:MAG: D-2-hydroxyacid dehydrogenase [Chloroflexota bacterium]
MKVLIGANPMGLEKGIPALQAKYPDIEFAFCPVREETAAAIADAEIYMGWMNRDLFLAGKKLRWVQSPSSGINYYLAIPEFVTSAVLLTSASGTHGACLSESCFGMIFAFTRQLKACIVAQPKHQWVARETRSKAVELTGSTMGIIGFGRVGRALAKRAVAFDLRVIAVDMFPTNKPEGVAELWGLDRLNELLKQSDFVVVTVPYTPDTDHMIGAEQIALMKPTAMLLGISRGHIIDEAALAAALKSGKLYAAGLDVFAQEPLPPESPLWDIENLVIMPHIAGGTQLEGQYVLEIFYENLDRFLNGSLPLRNQIDKVRGF